MHADEIRALIAGEVADDEGTRARYARDASIFEITPSLVAFPRHARDIGTLVRFVAERKRNGEHASLTVRAAGTDMTGGPLTESIVVDVARHLNKIEEVTDTHATAQPGVLYRDFERMTLKRHCIMPSYPASRESCALGGMVANNAGGEKT
ncbi:MAG: FAD-binding oxidoreductase, partial [Candidatus Liptonbacteria bacterium]|nr:FAD-binding oxidoreductase [Candidatus Liptonbacteria bacterium]